MKLFYKKPPGVFTQAQNEKNDPLSICYQVNEETNFENNPKLHKAEYIVL
jgi:hypothetical protein